MKFCPVCHFMLYTKYNSESGILSYYCKTCSWTGEYTDTTDTCVYKRNYSDDFIASKLNSNKYTILDPTLPRLGNIKCINDKCLTNKEVNKDLSVLVTEIPIDISEDEIKSRLSELMLSEHSIDRIGLDKVLITFNDIEAKTEGEGKLSYLTFGDKPVKIDEYKTIEREVIFIKYDNVNLKYLYICSTCNSSWKNI